MKKNTILLLIIFLLFVFLLLNNAVYAQINPEEQVKKYNVTFPVAELENCASFSACRTYCEDATHSDACIAFAKKKGFYKEKGVDTKKQALIQAAKTELGCDSETSCRATCEQKANFDKCQKFAQKNGLGEGQKNPADKAILQKAKTILGCDSPTSCKTICEQETNREKCSEFAKQAGLEGGIRHEGPGGCNSETSCRSYCEKNPDECKKFAGQNNQEGDREHQNKGPGGCDSEASCRKYCTEHPNECRRPSDDSEDKFSKQQDSSKIRGPGGCNSEESCRSYCEKNPDECQEKKPSGFREQGPSGMPPQPNVSGSPPANRFTNKGPGGCTDEESCKKYCAEHPQECGVPGKENRMTGKPETFQQQQNQTNPPRQFNSQTLPQQRTQGSAEQQREQIKQTNEFHPPENRVEDRRGENSGKPSEVKGISTAYSFFQRLLNFLSGK